MRTYTKLSNIRDTVKFLYKKGLSRAMVLIVSFFLIGNSWYGGVNQVHAQAYRGLIIDELRYVIDDVDRGDVIHRSFTVTHDFQQHDKKVDIHLKALNFESDGISGVPNFIESGKLDSSASLADWITFERDEIRLDHYQQKETINFTITIPQNAEPGDKYAAILVSDKAGEGAVVKNNNITETGLNKELGPLVFLTVNGDIHCKLLSDKLYTTDINGKERTLFWNTPVNVIAKLKNEGNVHSTPRGQIYIYKGTNFQDYEALYELNEHEVFVLADSTREFKQTWNDSFTFFKKVKGEDGKTKIVTVYDWNNLSKLRIGRYNVRLMFQAESADGSVITQEMDTFFWVIPWQLLVLILILLVLVTIYVIIKNFLKSVREKRK